MVLELAKLGSLDKLMQAYGRIIRMRAKLMMCEQVCCTRWQLDGAGHRGLRPPVLQHDAGPCTQQVGAALQPTSLPWPCLPHPADLQRHV